MTTAETFLPLASECSEMARAPALPQSAPDLPGRAPGCALRGPAACVRDMALAVCPPGIPLSFSSWVISKRCHWDPQGIRGELGRLCKE